MTNTLSSQDISRDALRKELRYRRNQLSAAEQHQAATNILKNLLKYPAFVRSQHVALYLASDGEVNPAVIASKLWQMKKHCYLPVLHPARPRQMWFVEFYEDTPLKVNRYGIGEPDPFRNHKLPAPLLDVVLMPLVGFDRAGNRLGMGGGFYDTTFAFKAGHAAGKPHLVGLAHSCQEVDRLPVEPWDIPLAAIATNQALIIPGNSR